MWGIGGATRLARSPVPRGELTLVTIVVVAAGDDQGYAVGYDTDREGGVGRVARSGVGGAGQRSATPCRRCGANRPAASYVSPWPRLVRCQRHC